jgi:transketolase
MIAANGITTKLRQIAIGDTYMQGASPKFLMRRYGIDAVALIEVVEQLVGQRFNLSEADLATARVDTYINEKQQEAL